MHFCSTHASDVARVVDNGIASNHIVLDHVGNGAVDLWNLGTAPTTRADTWHALAHAVLAAPLGDAVRHSLLQQRSV